MTVPADVTDESQGILSFFQTNMQIQKNIKKPASTTRINATNELEAVENETTLENAEQINKDERDSEPATVTEIDLLQDTDRQTPCSSETSSQEQNNTLHRVHDHSQNPTNIEPAGSQGRSTENKREVMKRQKELKRQQKEQEKRQREAQKQEEKLRREQQKEEEKLRREQQKEDDRKIREEKKKQKELERLQAKKQREDEKRQKEEERLKKEEQKRFKEITKEKSQLRIGNFFKKVSYTAKQLDLKSDATEQIDEKSDFKKYFLPFYAKDGTILPTDLITSHYDLQKSKSSLDTILIEKYETNQNKEDVSKWLNSKRSDRGYKIRCTATELLKQMTAKEKEDSELLSLLFLIPQKYIKFYENVRPPYIGTYSKDIILPVDNPFSIEETAYNYDYDSDLEWVNEENDDGEEGEIDNLESEEEDEDEDEDEASEGEFDGFLEIEDKSADGPQGKKRKFLGPLIPTVCLRSNINELDEDDKDYFEQIRVTYISEQQPFPIDPHICLVKQQLAGAAKRASPEDQNDPESASSSPSVSPQKKKPKALISDTKNLLKLFDEVDGSTFSLGTVTEIAQKNLPQYSKQLIKNTVKEYAVRGTGTTRKWQIKDRKHWEDLRTSLD